MSINILDGHDDEAPAEYVQYCKLNSKKILGLIIGSDNAAVMKGYAEVAKLTSKNCDSIYQAASENGAEKVKSFLTDYGVNY